MANLTSPAGEKLALERAPAVGEQAVTFATPLQKKHEAGSEEAAERKQELPQVCASMRFGNYARWRAFQWSGKCMLDNLCKCT